MNLEALAFGANSEFDDIRPVALSISQTTSSLLKSEISLLIECGDFLVHPNWFLDWTRLFAEKCELPENRPAGLSRIGGYRIGEMQGVADRWLTGG